MIGTTRIETITLNKNGDPISKDVVTCPERILSFKNDHKNNMGVLLLTDGQSAAVSDYRDFNCHSLYTFPYQFDDPNSITKIYAFAEGVFHELISSTELKSV